MVWLWGCTQFARSTLRPVTPCRKSTNFWLTWKLFYDDCLREILLFILTWKLFYDDCLREILLFVLWSENSDWFFFLNDSQSELHAVPTCCVGFLIDNHLTIDFLNQSELLAFHASSIQNQTWLCFMTLLTPIYDLRGKITDVSIIENNTSILELRRLISSTNASRASLFPVQPILELIVFNILLLTSQSDICVLYNSCGNLSLVKSNLKNYNSIHFWYFRLTHQCIILIVIFVAVTNRIRLVMS